MTRLLIRNSDRVVGVFFVPLGYEFSPDPAGVLVVDDDRTSDDARDIRVVSESRIGFV